MNLLPRCRLQSGFFFLVALFTFYGLPVAVAQEEQDLPSSSEEEIEKYEDIQELAKQKRIDAAVQENQTGTDPRDFSLKWMPYYRSTDLENGLKQQDLTAFGTVPFSRRLGMFFEVPLAQYRDFSDVPGFPPGTDAIGIGDIDLKFLWNPEALGFTYGKDGKMSGSILLGTDFVLPTATDDALAGDALLFAPIVGVVLDMPFYETGRVRKKPLSEEDIQMIVDFIPIRFRIAFQLKDINQLGFWINASLFTGPLKQFPNGIH